MAAMNLLLSFKYAKISVLNCDVSFVKVKLLATKGGKDVKDATRRIMSAFLSSNVAVNLNWTGQGGKKAFGKLKCAEIIRSMCCYCLLVIHIVTHFLPPCP